jgi:hypothetical protein
MAAGPESDDVVEAALGGLVGLRGGGLGGHASDDEARREARREEEDESAAAGSTGTTGGGDVGAGAGAGSGKGAGAGVDTASTAPAMGKGTGKGVLGSQGSVASLSSLGPVAKIPPRRAAFSPAGSAPVRNAPFATELSLAVVRTPLSKRALEAEALAISRLSSKATIAPQRDFAPTGRFKYHVNVGNNSGLIRRTFRARSGWSPAKSPWELQSLNGGQGLKKMDELNGATDFIWCQYLNQLGDLGNLWQARSSTRRVSSASACSGSGSANCNASSSGSGGGGSSSISTSKISSSSSSNNNSNSNNSSSGSTRCVVVNHLDNARVLVHKCGLYETLKGAGLLNLAPWTRVVRPSKESLEDGSLEAELRAGNEQTDRVYIVKPGALTNRGSGIRVVKGIEGVVADLGEALAKEKRSIPWIVQAYIERPLLIRGRKFDMRCYALVVFNADYLAGQEERADGVDGGAPAAAAVEPAPEADTSARSYQVYMHKRAYLRTACYDFRLDNLADRTIHLTNDAVQKHCKDYGAFEQANKLSLDQLAGILDEAEGAGAGEWVQEHFWPQVVEHTRVLFKAAVANHINKSKRTGCFELFGLDYMVEQLESAKQVRLIEVNDNPCLEEPCPLLKAIIPKVIEDTMEIALDCNFFIAEEHVETRPGKRPHKSKANEFMQLDILS